MSGLYEVERARHEREARERDARIAAEQEAAIEADAAEKAAEKRAELEARINEASTEAQADTLAAYRTTAAHELGERQRALEDAVNDSASSLDELFGAYRRMLNASEKLAAVNEFVARTSGRSSNQAEPPSFATIAQQAATRHAKSEGREHGFEVTHAVGQASLDAAAEVREREQ